MRYTAWVHSGKLSYSVKYYYRKMNSLTKTIERKGIDLNMEEKKINYFGLFGVITFNVVVFSSVLITIIALLLSLWVILFSFVVSPILLVIVNLFGLQDFSTFQTIASVLLLIVGIFVYPFAKKITLYTFVGLIRYLAFNKKFIYQ